MAGTPTTSPGRRARHDPDQSEREILAAAELLLRERPFREITVADIMSRTGLKRPAFYVHFRDRYELVLRVVEQIGAELSAWLDSWLDGSSPREDLAATLGGAARVYAAHGPVLRALADAAVSDASVETSYRTLVQGFIETITAHIAAEQAAGGIAAELDGRETARALVWLNERYFYETLGGAVPEDPSRVATVLTGIWVGALYP